MTEICQRCDREVNDAYYTVVKGKYYCPNCGVIVILSLYKEDPFQLPELVRRAVENLIDYTDAFIPHQGIRRSLNRDRNE